MPCLRWPELAGEAQRDRPAGVIRGRHADHSSQWLVEPVRQPSGYRDDTPAFAHHDSPRRERSRSGIVQWDELSGLEPILRAC